MCVCVWARSKEFPLRGDTIQAKRNFNWHFAAQSQATDNKEFSLKDQNNHIELPLPVVNGANNITWLIISMANSARKSLLNFWEKQKSKYTLLAYAL